MINEGNEKKKNGGRKMLYFLIGVAAIILIVVLVNKAKKPSAALYDAIRDGDHEKLAKILKKTNPEVLARTRHNYILSHLLEAQNPTPLQYACEVGDLETVRMMIEAGTNVNAPMAGYDWGNPLWYANRRHDRDRFKVRKLLVDAGADCTGSPNAMLEMMSLEPEEWDDEEICRSQLELFSMVYELVGASSDVPMMEAHPNLLVRAAGVSGLPVVKFLIEKGYPINPEPDPQTGHTQGDTPLHSAATAAYTPNVEYLLSAGADINLRNFNDQTPLEALLEKIEKIKTEDWLKSQRDRLDEYEHVADILRSAGER